MDAVDAEDASEAYAALLRALATDAGPPRLAARQREAVERLSRAPERREQNRPEALAEAEAAECTFRPRINGGNDRSESDAATACARLYALGRERQTRQTLRCEAAEAARRADAAADAPTFQPALVTATRRRAGLRRDVFSSLYADATRLARRRDVDENAENAENAPRSRPDRSDVVRSIVDQLARFT